MCNEYQHKPMPFGVKVRKLYSRQFILPADVLYWMTESVEHGGWQERQCVECIDEHGAWLDG